MRRRKTVTVKMTPRAAEFYGALLCKIGGKPDGPRAEVVTSVLEQLRAQDVRSADATMRAAEWRQYWLDEKTPVIPGILCGQWPAWSAK